MIKQKIFCKECGVQTEYVIDNFCRYHLKPNHNMTTKEYYDKHIKKENEGKCLNCGKETSFKSYTKGYSEFCSIDCLNKSKEMSKRVSEGRKDLNYEVINAKIKNTMLSKYGVEHAMQSKEIKEKVHINNLKKYGTEYTINLPQVREAAKLAIEENFDEINLIRGKSIQASSKEANIKRRKTVFEKFGVHSISQVKEIVNKARETIKRKYGFKTDDELECFERYRKEVRRHTNSIKNNIVKSSKCYYTNIIMDYENKDNHNKFQATIDHKKSIIYGFKNNIDPSIIGNINNLCFCCRFVNSIKNYKCEEEFKESKKFIKIIERIRNGEFNSRL